MRTNLPPKLHNRVRIYCHAAWDSTSISNSPKAHVTFVARIFVTCAIRLLVGVLKDETVVGTRFNPCSASPLDCNIDVCGQQRVFSSVAQEWPEQLTNCAH
ncbi:unnamed protein product [Ostreobium quekettii]|uniref:Uncharacterized protein n=1 Tax=Ostreobium quekettii TaxID=121088 RepID=A0A8S1IW79_9CHLO|nr:unnamed protein product [Ostreobium quekettii]